MRSNLLLSFIFALLITLTVSSQESYDTEIISGSEKLAADNFRYYNYFGALTEYLFLLNNDSANILYNYRAGICYLNTHINKQKALEHLLIASKQPSIDEYFWYDLGRAYQYNFEFDKAIVSFEKFIEEHKGKENNYISAERQIEICHNAKILVANPLHVTIEPLGSEINSEYPDFNPFITSNGQKLFFASKREGNTGNLVDFDGYFTTDIYESELEDQEWSKAKRFSPLVNTGLVEEITGISADGEEIYLFLLNQYAVNDVYMSRTNGRSYDRPVSLGVEVNFDDYIESSASVSPDKNILVFSSDRPHGYGSNDIYFSRRLPDGHWSEAENCGEMINTPYDEDFPSFSPDGTTLYFSSAGHSSMGALDIFQARFDPETYTFSKPENLGYPINTPENNTTISFTESKRFAYASYQLENGFGDLDICRITFQDIPPEDVTLRIELFGNDSVPFFQYLTNMDHESNRAGKLLIDSTGVSDKVSQHIDNRDMINSDLKISIYSDSGKPYGIFRPSRYNSIATALLPPGKYTYTIAGSLISDKSGEFEIKDIEGKKRSISRKIILETI